MRAAAHPAPVATVGLGVMGYACPAPPVASSVTGATKRVMAFAAVSSTSAPRHRRSQFTCGHGAEPHRDHTGLVKLSEPALVPCGKPFGARQEVRSPSTC